MALAFWKPGSQLAGVVAYGCRAMRWICIERDRVALFCFFLDTICLHNIGIRGNSRSMRGVARSLMINDLGLVGRLVVYLLVQVLCLAGEGRRDLNAFLFRWRGRHVGFQ